MSSLKLLALFISTLALAAALDVEEVHAFITNVPQKDNLEFLRYAVTLGYHRSTGRTQFGGLNIPNLFEDVYEFYMIHGILDEVPEPMGEEIVCFPTGCVDIKDPGIHPE